METSDPGLHGSQFFCLLPGGPHGSIFASCFTTGGPLFRWTPRAGEGSAAEKTFGELHYPLLIH